MRESTVDVTLTAREWKLISTLRAIPPGPLSIKVTTLIDGLVEFIHDPKCAKVQGDGVPCDNVSTACEQCAHVAEMLESMDRVGSLMR